MIDDTQREHWKTKAEASEILKCSEKTISRLAAQKRIQQLMRRNPGRRAQPVFSPDDIEALRGDQDQIEAFPVATERNAPGTALARRDTAVSTVGVLAQLLADRLSDIVKCCGRGGSGGALFDQFSILEFLSF